MKDYDGGGRRTWFQKEYPWTKNYTNDTFVGTDHSGYIAYATKPEERPGAFFYFSAVSSNKMLIVAGSNFRDTNVFFAGDLEKFKSFLSTIELTSAQNVVLDSYPTFSELYRWSETRKTVWEDVNLGLKITTPEWTESRYNKGRDENGTLHKQVFLTKLEVEKKSHDLRFLTLELSPSVMKCSKTANINYGIINLGQEDEKNAAVEIKNSDLNLDLMESGILINSGAEDNLFAKTASFKISENVENKEYPITASLYSGDNLYDTAAATLKVEECGKNMASIKKSSFYPLELDQSIDGNSVKGETQDSKAKMSSAESSSQDDDRNRRLLVISTLVFVNFFVFGAMFSVFAKKS